jgi:hypothetical protein
MAENLWLFEEIRPLDDADLRELERELPTRHGGVTRSAEGVPNIAIRLKDLTIHDNKKWFGGANIRVDALIVHGNVDTEGDSFYMPGTFRFPGVASGEKLPTGENGLLIFFGKPQYFIDIFLLVSRDKKDTADLGDLLKTELNNASTKGAVTALMSLAVAAPHVATITTALSAATTIGVLAHKILNSVTGNTIGLYRANWLQHRDGFGIGRHPDNPPNTYKLKDLSFYYEIVPDEGR